MGAVGSAFSLCSTLSPLMAGMLIAHVGVMSPAILAAVLTMFAVGVAATIDTTTDTERMKEKKLD